MCEGFGAAETRVSVLSIITTYSHWSFKYVQRFEDAWCDNESAGVTAYKATSLKAHCCYAFSSAEDLKATHDCDSNAEGQMVDMYCRTTALTPMEYLETEERTCTFMHEHSSPSECMTVQRGQSSHLYLMTLIPLRQPIRELGVSGRPALATRYLPNMCRGLLPPPINSPRMEGRRDGERKERH